MIVWSKNEFNYLAIGNSLTLHGRASYWWNSNGMAASDKEHDYFHLVMNHLKQKHEVVHGEAYNLYTWETQNNDRDETLSLLEYRLDSNINLITIQLGENASNLTTFERDYETLIYYIKKKAPYARIIVIGDFWTLDNRDELKKEASEKTGVEYVTLEGIKDNEEYYAGMGTTVYGDDGEQHKIDHQGVASHPGDNGMKEIAQRVIEVIDKQ